MAFLGRPCFFARRYVHDFPCRLFLELAGVKVVSRLAFSATEQRRRVMFIPPIAFVYLFEQKKKLRNSFDGII